MGLLDMALDRIRVESRRATLAALAAWVDVRLRAAQYQATEARTIMGAPRSPSAQAEARGRATAYDQVAHLLAGLDPECAPPTMTKLLDVEASGRVDGYRAALVKMEAAFRSELQRYVRTNRNACAQGVQSCLDLVVAELVKISTTPAHVDSPHTALWGAPPAQSERA
jgi:hypothetical protein